MRLKVGMWLGALAVAAMGLGVLGGAGTAAAQEPATAEELGAPYFFGDGTGMPRWLRYSIVYCAARTMDVDVDKVKLGLRLGHSLKEMGIRAGVRPIALESGILRCEHHLLERLAQAGELEPSEARRVFQFLTAHMTRIINWQWPGAGS